jgi:hypothetical protein
VNVLVYVEGPSDRAGLEALLRELMARGRRTGVGISFYHRGGKGWILQELGRTAARHLKSRAEDYVFALPDLYPMAQYERTGDRHRSMQELQELLRHRFSQAADEVGLPESVRAHYRPHCLKHDLEALLLGVPELLKQRLGTRDALEKNWRKPVEEQNDHAPPKRVVEQLFRKYRKRQAYIESVDTPWVLGRANPQELCQACPQSFRPFFTELNRLVEGQRLDDVRGLKVDPAKVGGAHIFRPWGWTVALLVSEHVKRALEREGVTGTRFTEV